MRSTRVYVLTSLLALTGVAGAGVLAPVPAQAQDKNAERLRLEEEMKKLAQRNAWSGVERKYEDLTALGVELPQDDHLLGAQAARYLGKTYEVYTRLEKAKKIQETDDIKQEMGAIDGAYGRVELKGSERFLPAVTPEVMPFAPDQQKSIAWATEVMTNTGSFKGMLPAGKYKVACQEFDVVPGPNFLVIPVEKPSKKELTECLGEGAETIATEGVIAYVGPVAAVGYNFMANTEPGDPVTDLNNSAIYQAQAQSVTGSGVSLIGGVEVGFNGANSTFGTALTLSYTGMLAGQTADAQRPATFHGGMAWLAATIRPGDLRVAVGPTWSMYYGSGTGAACWYELAPSETWDPGPDDGPDPCLRPSDPRYEPNAIEWRGVSLAPGAALTVGYGVLELGGLMGVVELGGNWATDGERQIINAGIRVGFVPAIDRFEG